MYRSPLTLVIAACCFITGCMDRSASAPSAPAPASPPVTETHIIILTPVESLPVAVAPPAPPLELLSGSLVPTTFTIAVDAHWMPTGRMGDAITPGIVEMRRIEGVPGEPPSFWRLTCRTREGGEGWAAVSWQNIDNNWGEHRGINLAELGKPRRLTAARFDARAHRDGIPVRFRIFGHTGPGAPFPASSQPRDLDIVLTTQVQPYAIRVPDYADLTNLPTAFVIVIEAARQPADDVTIDVSDIRFVAE